MFKGLNRMLFGICHVTFFEKKVNKFKDYLTWFVQKKMLFFLVANKSLDIYAKLVKVVKGNAKWKS